MNPLAVSSTKRIQVALHPQGFERQTTCRDSSSRHPAPAGIWGARFRGFEQQAPFCTRGFEQEASVNRLISRHNNPSGIRAIGSAERVRAFHTSRGRCFPSREATSRISHTMKVDDPKQSTQRPRPLIVDRSANPGWGRGGGGSLLALEVLVAPRLFDRDAHLRHVRGDAGHGRGACRAQREGRGRERVRQGRGTDERHNACLDHGSHYPKRYVVLCVARIPKRGLQSRPFGFPGAWNGLARLRFHNL